MKYSRIKVRSGRWLFCLLLLLICGLPALAQSTNSEYPTPITSNEISGKIRARDLGDARLTSYYYVFNGTQGDVFINITANNFNGDIDVFAADGLRPLSKIRLYADSSPTETGRIVYLRQPLKLILRIEGATPDDNPATFSVKFAGSFAAMDSGAAPTNPTAPKIESGETGAVKVNSVGTIIEPTPERREPEKKIVSINPPPKPKKVRETPNSTLPKLIITEKIDSNKNTEDKDNKADTEIAVESKTEPIKTKEPIIRNRRTTRKPTVNQTPPESTSEAKAPPKANPLENVRLVVVMKTGDKIEYPMTEVFRFSLNNNVLTIILKDGKIERRSILDIQKFSVE